jgi:hypothetical protein
MMRIFISLLLVLSVHFASAQKKLVDTILQSYFAHLPLMASSIDEAHRVYYPKGKTTPCKQYMDRLKKELSVLADQSNHRSRLVSMLSGRYDEESVKYDFTKVVVGRDKQLETTMNTINLSVTSIWRDHLRTVNSRMDSASKQYKGVAFASKELEIYRQETPLLINDVKKLLTELDKLMNEKGYNKVLLEHDASHPYYVQILEARAIMLDRLWYLTLFMDGAQDAVAIQVDYCKKSPEWCK